MCMYWGYVVLLRWYSFDGKLGSHLDFFHKLLIFTNHPLWHKGLIFHMMMENNSQKSISPSAGEAIKKQRNGFPCPLFSSYDLWNLNFWPDQ